MLAAGAYDAVAGPFPACHERSRMRDEHPDPDPASAQHIDAEGPPGDAGTGDGASVLGFGEQTEVPAPAGNNTDTDDVPMALPLSDAHLDDEAEGVHPRARGVAVLTLSIGLIAAVAVAFLWISRPDADRAVGQPDEPTVTPAVTDAAAEVEAEASPATVNRAVPYEGEPLWTIAPQGEAVAPVSGGVLVRSAEELYFEEDGTVTWSQPINAPGHSSVEDVVHLSGDVVLVESPSPNGTSGEQTLTARDAATGEELWQVEDVLDVAVFDTVALLFTIEHADRDAIVAVARDVHDGSVRWHTETTLPSADVTIGTDQPVPVGFAGGDPLPAHFVVAAISSDPSGYSTQVSAFDTATGEHLAGSSSDVDFDSVNARVAGDMLLVQTGEYFEPVSGCAASVAAYRIGDAAPGQAPVWEQWVDAEQDGERCLQLPPLHADQGLLPASDGGLPVLLDVTTGETAWSSDEARGFALAAHGNVLLAVDEDATQNRTAVWNLETDTVHWEGYRFSDLWVQGDRLWAASQGRVIGYDSATTESISLPGSFAYTLPGVIVTRVGNEWHAWPDNI